MGVDPIEDPPIKPGQPTEPPQEEPPGNPRPEIPPPMRDPGDPAPPQELPGRTPYPVTDAGISDLPGSEPDVLPGELPSGTM